jgi:hypothetical protein
VKYFNIDKIGYGVKGFLGLYIAHTTGILLADEY